MTQDQLIDWLLEGDVSIQYQVWRDLLGEEKKGLQERIAREGWGHRFLLKRRPDGHWGDRFYQPKWTSTFYTLLDLRNLNTSPQNAVAKETIDLVLRSGKAGDGGIALGPSTTEHSDVCANAMFLNCASYFHADERALHSIVDAILQERMPDGGFNCRTTRSGARHSSLHTTLSVMEGLTEFRKAGYRHHEHRIRQARASALEFVLLHRLFLSDRTGEVISKDFLKLTYPCRWRYDVLRAMDHFQYAGIPWDGRMEAALAVLENKRNPDGTWSMNAAHAGQVHFTMEQAGRPSRWNTLRMLRVLRKYT